MQVVLGLGTNLGDREDNLARALDALERLEGTQLLKLSNLYETEPFDVVSQQDNYLNCCVLLETSLKPETLLERCLEIEHSLGRVRTEYHGARTMDIDVLLCQESFRQGYDAINHLFYYLVDGTVPKAEYFTHTVIKIGENL